MYVMRTYWPALLLYVFPVLTIQQYENLQPYNIVNRMIELCSISDKIKECIEEEAAETLEAALNLDAIPLAPGISLQRDYQQNTETPKSLTTYSTEHTTAYDRFWESLNNLINSRSIAINMTELQVEGRGKKKKMLKYVVVALITIAIILIPIKLKLIAWVAASALLIGKLALLLGSLVGLKILVSKPHEDTTYLHYDSHRSDPAHYLAYGGYDLPPGNSVDYY